MPTSPFKIISGGQTGVDRAALDAALAAGVACGGWCPTGREAEDGPIPDRYPVWELQQGGYSERTLCNVAEADGTLIICFDTPAGGTAETLAACLRLGTPHLLIDGQIMATAAAAERTARWISEHGIGILNVAGPRASTAARAYPYALDVIASLLRLLPATRSSTAETAA